MKRSAGFSLVELSIVLVIIGLLAGGVLAGRSLIRGAELRSITSDVQKFKAAGVSFRDKYSAPPGDMTNATQYWGAADPTPATCKTTSSVGSIATCDGDNNGLIDSSAGSFEYYRAWQQLANAGMIEGQYSGYYATTWPVPGIDQPAAKLAQTYWSISPNNYFAGSTFQYAGDWGNTLIINRVGQAKTVADSYPLNPEDSWNIDSKIDDGLPGSGVVLASKGNATNTNCTSVANLGAGSDSSSTYRLDVATRDCGLNFLRTFQ